MANDELHPRPQMTRPHWRDLCGTWQFAYDDANAGLDQHWIAKTDVFDRNITVPFPPESPASGIDDTGMHPVVWYRRTVRVTSEEATGRLLLHFGAVDYQATVWVNGQCVAQHEGGNTPFSVDITSVLRPVNEDQVIVVRAEDQPTDLTQPRGKQYWEAEPRRIWYNRTTGIWQPVWLEPVPTTYITNVRWTPDVDRGKIGLQVTLNRVPVQPVLVRVRLSLQGVPVANDVYEIERSSLQREISLDSAHNTMNRERSLWSPDHPNLFDATISLEEPGNVLDTVQSYVGLRSTGFSDNRFLLNGHPTYLRMVLEQGYWPDSHLAAPTPDALRREVELIKALGFNCVRIHQKVEDPRFLYWCDKLGLMVWGEMANAYVFSPTAVERFNREWLEVVARDYNHPCIVAWVPFNESWGVPNLERDPAQRNYVRGIYYITKTLDPTRPVIGNDGWEHIVGDVWGIHDYALEGETIRERYGTPEAVERTLYTVLPHLRHIVLPENQRAGQPVMITECGGFVFAPRTGETVWGYATVTDTEQFRAKYADLIGAILDCPTVTGFCYTQLTDTMQETNGLLRADRSSKLDIATVRKINQQPAKSMPNEALLALQQAMEVTNFQTI